MDKDCLHTAPVQPDVYCLGSEQTRTHGHMAGTWPIQAGGDMRYKLRKQPMENLLNFKGTELVHTDYSDLHPRKHGHIVHGKHMTVPDRG